MDERVAGDESLEERPAEPGLTPQGRLPSSPRGGCALPAGGSATAVTVGSAMAAVPRGSSFIWPSFTVTTTSRSIWRGESHESKRVADTRSRSRGLVSGRFLLPTWDVALCIGQTRA